jgi:Protein of unknown function (DUF2384)
MDSELDALRRANDSRLSALKAEVLRDSLSIDEAARALGCGSSAVKKMVEGGALLAVSDADALRFPAWQFDRSTKTGLIANPHDVLAVMDASPLRKAAWFIHPHPHLGNRTPIDLLHSGDAAAVIVEAKAVTSP